MLDTFEIMLKTILTAVGFFFFFFFFFGQMGDLFSIILLKEKRHNFQIKKVAP